MKVIITINIWCDVIGYLVMLRNNILTLSRVDSSTWRLGPRMCKTAKNCEPWPPKIETTKCDVYSIHFQGTNFRNSLDIAVGI